ncbi:MAG: dihydroorotase [Acholeplasmatales bacterium]|nr:dihydroorotase [Acholeplasmatales bacterium]
MILIKNGSIVINNELVKKDILIEDNVITRIEDTIEGDYEIYDARGCLVMPGAVDVHVHLREPGYEYKETVKTGSLSALKGGVTTIMSMPNLKPVPDNLDALKVQLDRINSVNLINIYPYGAVTVNQKDEVMANIEELAPYVKAITDDGFGVNNLEVLEEAMKLAKKHDLVIASHAEDKVYKYAPEGEYVAVRREIEMAKKIGCKYHFCHMSTKESFEAIRKAQQEGYTNITCEVAPHHLVLNETMIKNGNWKMNPPLRSEENRLATIEALLDGTACMVASDHAPHSKEEKNNPEYSKNLNGIIGLETMLPIIYTEFVKTGKITYERFIDIMVNNPAKVFNLPQRTISVGSVADIAVIDIENKHVYEEAEIVSMGKNTPFIGFEYYGYTKYTFVNGKLAYKC